MPSFSATKKGYGNMWRDMRLTKPASVARIVDRIMVEKNRYQEVETATNGIPWYLIAAIHYRESNLGFAGILHSGETGVIGTGRKSTRLHPTGVGPFHSWSDSAIDALRRQGMHKVKDWSIERVLFEAEKYNGWGYTYKKVNSPYIWASTDKQKPGKYTSDGPKGWDPKHMDTQAGVAAIIRGLADIDPEVRSLVDDVNIKTPPPTQQGPATIPRTAADLSIAELVALLKKHPGVKGVLVEW